MNIIIDEIFWEKEYIAKFVEILMCTYFCSAFMGDTESKRNSKLYAAALAVLATIVFGELYDTVLFSYKRKLMLIGLCIIVQWIYFQRKYMLSICVAVIYAEIVAVIETVVTFVVLNMDFPMTEREMMTLIYKIAAIGIFTYVSRRMVPKTSIPKIYLVIMCLYSAVFMMYDWLWLGTESELRLPDGFVDFLWSTFFVASFVFQIVIIFFVMKIAEGHQQKQTNALIALNNKMLQKSLDETEQTFELWRQSVHDYKNHVIVLKQMADDEKFDEIKSYLKQEDETISKNLFYIKTGNSVVDTIMNIKHSLAEKNHIPFLVHAKLPADFVVTDMDIANILGNLLDNAVEASLKEEDPYIDITMKQEKNFFILNVRNKCTQIVESGRTSKENAEFHGIGLKSVKRTVKKYDGEMTIEQNNQEYIVNIMIQNKGDTN